MQYKPIVSALLAVMMWAGGAVNINYEKTQQPQALSSSTSDPTSFVVSRPQGESLEIAGGAESAVASDTQEYGAGVRQAEATASQATLIPELEKVCQCESGGRQYGVNGAVIKGVVNPSDTGICQINEYYHGEAALDLGLDIHTEEGNILYANYLFETSGYQPWEASRYCWQK